MLMNETRLTLTVEEGNCLFGIASGFALPEKLTDGQSYSQADRVLANMETALFYAALEAKSPIRRSKRRLLFFGPEDCYEEIIDAATGRTGRRVVDPDREVEIVLDEVQMRGLYWCLLARLHPMSSAISGSGDQHSLVWPIARKAEYENFLKEQIGLDKAQPRVIKRDSQYKKIPAPGNGNGKALPAEIEKSKA